MKCNLCPRKCNVERSEKTGYCGQGHMITAARADLHMWEEPCISGDEGSGTVFFSGCSLKCVYCQNRKISSGEINKEITPYRLAEIFIELQDKKANNINLVTADHFIIPIMEAITVARKNGLTIPIILNTSGYLTPQTVKMLKGYVDIFLTDFKYWDCAAALRYSACADYPKWAKSALEEMVNVAGEPEYDSRGIMQKGVIVRHMVLPEYTEDAKKIIEYVHNTYGNKVVLSIMNQYTPINMEKYPEINRRVTSHEYNEVINFALDTGVEEAYVQEEGTVSESFIPEFNFKGI